MKNIIIFSLLLFFVFTACKKDEIEEPLQSAFDNGILCMNEGLFQQNNASLSFYSLDSNQLKSNVFSKINGRGLGDTANDMIQYMYNGKPYVAIAVDVSSQVEIIDALTLKSVKQIPVFNGNSAREPRSLEYYNGYLYVINFDGTVSIIDLSLNSIITNLSAGLNPNQSVIKNDQLIVVNSGGLNSPDYDNTITIIDLTTNSVTTTHETAINCGSIILDSQNDIYLTSNGNYTDIDSKLLRLDDNYNVVETFEISMGPKTFYKDVIYYFDYADNAIHKLNTLNETIASEKLIDCSAYQNIYNIQINPKNDFIYITDANGYVNSSVIKCYDLNGNFKYEFTSGLNTGKLLFN